MNDDQQKSLQESIEHLSSRIDRQNELLAVLLRNQKSVKARLLAGLWTGLGTVLGATVLVSVIILMLKPLSKIDWISPIVDRVIDALETRGTTPRQHRDRTDRQDPEQGLNTPKSNR